MSHSFSWNEHFPRLLFFLYLLVFVFLGIAPYSREIWIAENGPIVIIVATLFVLYLKGIRFSNMAYALMSILIFMHTIGGHFTFERVPFDWFNHFFGFERNMYDRIAHFSVGFYAFAIAEQLANARATQNKIVFFLFPLFAIAFVAMGYEIVEWMFAVMSDPEAGLAFLGSQGDIWDAQKDMLADILGALFALGLYLFLRSDRPYKKIV